MFRWLNRTVACQKVPPTLVIDGLTVESALLPGRRDLSVRNSSMASGQSHLRCYETGQKQSDYSTTQNNDI